MAIAPSAITKTTFDPPSSKTFESPSQTHTASQSSIPLKGLRHRRGAALSLASISTTHITPSNRDGGDKPEEGHWGIDQRTMAALARCLLENGIPMEPEFQRAALTALTIEQCARPEGMKIS